MTFTFPSYKPCTCSILLCRGPSSLRRFYATRKCKSKHDDDFSVYPPPPPIFTLSLSLCTCVYAGIPLRNERKATSLRYSLCLWFSSLQRPTIPRRRIVCTNPNPPNGPGFSSNFHSRRRESRFPLLHRHRHSHLSAGLRCAHKYATEFLVQGSS